MGMDLPSDDQGSEEADLCQNDCTTTQVGPVTDEGKQEYKSEGQETTDSRQGVGSNWIPPELAMKLSG